MQNIKVLNRIPDTVISTFVNLYESRFAGKDLRQKYTGLFYINRVDNATVSVINQQLPIPVATIELYFFDPKRGRGQPHIDRGRKTAFQIPIKIDTDNSYTYSFNGTDLSNLTPNSKYSHHENPSITTSNTPDHWFYEWDDALFDKYSLEKPILQNAAQPHGGANFSDQNRIFFSCSYKEDFDFVKSKFSEWI